MSAVFRLVLSYFTATPALRVFSAIGLALCVFAFLIMRTARPPEYGPMLALTGVIALYIGSSLMPLMVGRMARSHSIWTLPQGRFKLMLSALITVALVALPVPLIPTFGELPAHADAEMIAVAQRYMRQMLLILYTSSFMLAGWLYVALWFVTSDRTKAGFFKAMLVLAVIIFAPVRQITELEASLRQNLIHCGASVLLFSAGFLLWPRLRTLAGHLRRRFPRFEMLQRQVSGREIDLMLGTANPWLLAGAQILPIAIVARIGFYSESVWLYYLTLLSTVAGAIAGQAAERSRALWLRGHWSRAELFAQVERSFWRHNACVLGALLVLMLIVGRYMDVSLRLLVTGMPLLALGTMLSTCLGLMITARLRWSEAVLAISIMLALMAVAVLAARSTFHTPAVVALAIALAVVGLVLRSAARDRWLRIDWMMCRPDRLLAPRPT